MANRSHLNAFNFHTPRIGCLIQCCLHPVGDLLPWIKKKLLSVLTSPMVIEKIKNLYKRLSENTRRRLWYLSERISARHFVPSTFLKIMILQNPCLHLSPRSPESCCPQEAGWVAEVLDIVCCLVWHFLLVMVIVREVMLTHMTYDIYDQSHWHTMVGFETL